MHALRRQGWTITAISSMDVWGELEGQPEALVSFVAIRHDVCIEATPSKGHRSPFGGMEEAFRRSERAERKSNTLWFLLGRLLSVIVTLCSPVVTLLAR